MEHFYIITNRPKDAELKITNHIKHYLEQRRKRCTIQNAELPGENIYTDAQSVPADVDCILVLGGDGTMLQAARDTRQREIPFLGVNLGTLGFMAEVELANLDNALECLVDGRYHIEERMLLNGRIFRSGKVIEDTYALNDIVVTRGGTLRIIDYNILVNGQFLREYRADGIIVSTPMGSTGYNMSAGGPIVEPGAKLMVLTPICPHTLNTRSIVLAAEDEVTIEIVAGKSSSPPVVEANFDGSYMKSLVVGDEIQIKKSPKVIKIVKLSQASFLETLHRKMNGA